MSCSTSGNSSSGAGGSNGNNSGDRDAERKRQEAYDALRRREEGRLKEFFDLKILSGLLNFVLQNSGTFM